MYSYPKIKEVKNRFKKTIQGIYKGLTATMAKQGSNQAIRFFVMETLKDWYRGGDNSKSISKPIVGLMGAVAGAASVYGIL